MIQYIDGCRAKQANLVNYFAGYGPYDPIPSYSGADLEHLRLKNFPTRSYVIPEDGIELEYLSLSAADMILGIIRQNYYFYTFGEDLEFLDGPTAAFQYYLYFNEIELDDVYPSISGSDVAASILFGRTNLENRMWASGADAQYAFDVYNAGFE